MLVELPLSSSLEAPGSLPEASQTRSASPSGHERGTSEQGSVSVAATDGSDTVDESGSQPSTDKRRRIKSWTIADPPPIPANFESLLAALANSPAESDSESESQSVCVPVSNTCMHGCRTNSRSFLRNVTVVKIETWYARWYSIGKMDRHVHVSHAGRQRLAALLCEGNVVSSRKAMC